MTKTDTALPGPVHRPSVPRCQLKKVTRRSSRLSRCCANVSEDDASIRLTAIHCEALPASSRPSAAAFASTQQPQQNVHQAMLVSSSEHTPQNSSNESVVPVAGGRTKEYCDWWCEQVLEQSDLSLFNVRLIGDAGSPQLFTSMARNDLAYCSKWGHNRISLSMSNVEAVLVLANAVGFASLETACTDYLHVQAQKMTGDALICLAKLADHLGLSSLLETAAEALIKMPWEENTLHLNELLQMSLYERDTARRDKLLHHPKRGAYTELQLLELLNAANTPWSGCISAIDLEGLQPSELHALLGIFGDNEWDPDSEALLRPAFKQQLMPEALRFRVDWTKPVRILHNIMLPEQGGSNNSVQIIPLRECCLELHITHRHRKGQETVDLYLYPTSDSEKTIEDLFRHLTLFSVHTRAPYLRTCRTASHAQIKQLKLAAHEGVGWSFGELKQCYPANYSGPFIIGVCWQDA
ncbi:hypothetical protein WJX79_004573 [Trebouxia sp. C0005]